MKFAVTNKESENKTIYMGNPYIKMIEEKLNEELNNYCVECGNEDPEYISINNGIFICGECVQNHFKFPKNISKIIKNNLKSLTLKEIQPLLCGGNKALLDFINNEFPKLSEFPPHILYRTQAMSYYRHFLQFLINGGVPPVKPSVKYAYKISNFYQNYDSNNVMPSETNIYNNMRDEQIMENNINSIGNFTNFYKTGNNFTYGRNITKNNMNYYNDRLVNTINNIGHTYDNYIINKPRQINFQNNNNIIIGNIGNNNERKIVYSPQKIKVDFKNKNKRNKLTNKKQIKNNTINGQINITNEVYVKPKLLLSPKSIGNNAKSERRLNKRTCSADLIKKNYTIQERNDLLEKGQIINFQNSFRHQNHYLNRNFSQDSFFKNHNPLNIMNNMNSKKYIKKNRYIHKSLSQTLIKNDIQNYSTNNKYFPLDKSDINEFTIIKHTNPNEIFNTINNQICISDNIEFQFLQKKNKNKNKNKKNLMIKNHEKFSTEETLNFSEVESLPIKINLKLNKKDYETKKNLNKDIKYVFTNNSINKKSIKDEKKVIRNYKDKNDEKNKNKNSILKKTVILRKNCSQEDLLKDYKSNKKKVFENGLCLKNDEKITVSIRNKYKSKNKNK